MDGSGRILKGLEVAGVSFLLKTSRQKPPECDNTLKNEDGLESFGHLDNAKDATRIRRMISNVSLSNDYYWLNILPGSEADNNIDSKSSHYATCENIIQWVSERLEAVLYRFGRRARPYGTS
jgi:hypothetical protein